MSEDGGSTHPGDETGDKRLIPEVSDTDTVDFGGEPPPKQFELAENIEQFLRHLEDACPAIALDVLEAEEFQARYIIGKELGSGAIGQVIEAIDTHLGRRVAIKILHGGQGVSRDRLARFIAEAQITAQLEHPAVVPVHEIGRMPGGMPYFAMKLVRGDSLEDVINNLRVGDAAYTAKYSGKYMVRVFFRICQGVAYAHHKGVVHRDLKPANILMGQYGDVQVMDWGLAKIMSGVPAEAEADADDAVRTVRDAPDLGTLDGAIAGTPAYMSPEQAKGDNDRVGPWSDVYGLGLILAELLTLVRVFRGGGSNATLNAVKESGPVDVDTLSQTARVPRELAAIVRKCTEPDPANRYRHAEELSEDVRHYLEDREVAIAPDAHPQKLVKWSRRNPMFAGALFMGLAICSIRLCWFWIKPLLLRWLADG